MRLLFITERFHPDPGGLAVSAGRISLALTRMGHPVEVLAFSNREGPGRAASSLVDQGLGVHRLGAFDDVALTIEQGERLALLLHRRHLFKAVWGHGLGTAGFLATALSRRVGMPLLLSARGDDFDRLFYPPGDFARLEWCLRSAAAINAVSAELAGRIQGVTGRPVTVLPNAVDCDKFRPAPRPSGLALRYGLRPDDLVLGFSGELRAGKGMAHLLDAFRQARATRPTCKLLLIGDVHPDDRPELQRIVSATPGLANGIVRTGHVRESRSVARLLHLCDVMLLPSLREGLPNSLLEALASGVPVVAAAVGGVTEALTEGKGGVLVPRTHLHLFGRRVLEVLEWPPERRRAVVEAGRSVVLERFTPERERERLSLILGHLSGQARASHPTT
jgi:glycosyltransferase involved in cell wall biosynthesis